MKKNSKEENKVKDSLNINYDKIDRLVSLFIQLDDDGQNKVMAEALMQLARMSQKRNGLVLEDEITEGVNKEFNDIVNLVELLKKLNDKNKAAIFMEMQMLAYKGLYVPEVDVKVNVNMSKRHLREIMAESYPTIDFDEMYKYLVKYNGEYENEHKQ